MQFPGPTGRAIACLSKTATQESTELLKERLHSFYVEQLVRRPKPENRSQVSWGKILYRYQEAFEQRLEQLHSVPEVWQFGLKCLSQGDLREAFIVYGAEEVADSCVPESTQLAHLHPQEESSSFERDLEAADAELHLLLRGTDCEPASSSVRPASPASRQGLKRRHKSPRASQTFNRALKQSDSVIDLE